MIPHPAALADASAFAQGEPAPSLHPKYRRLHHDLRQHRHRLQSLSESLMKLKLTLLSVLILMAFTPNKAWDKIETPPDRYTHGLYSAKTLRTHAVNAFCAEKLGEEAPYNQKYIGCYVPREDLIILPMNPPKELIEHEEAHARGWRHK